MKGILSGIGLGVLVSLLFSTTVFHLPLLSENKNSKFQAEKASLSPISRTEKLNIKIGQDINSYYNELINNKNRDEAELFSILRDLSDKNYLPAQTELGIRLLNKQSMDMKLEGVKWLEKAAQYGNVKAASVLGMVYSEGLLGKVDYFQSTKWYKSAAEQGDANSQHNLAISYSRGRGIMPSNDEAFYWFQKAADQGVLESYHALGIAYATGKGVRVDDLQARTYFEKAAALNHPGSLYLLGNYWEEGRFGPQKIENILDLYKKSATLGFTAAQYHLGMIYKTGLNGVAPDSSESIRWLLMASKTSAEAQFALAEIYETGLGINKNTVMAQALYKKSIEGFGKRAEEGDAVAEFAIGSCYRHGRGLPVDLDKAEIWLSRSSEKGNLDAKKLLKEIREVAGR